MLTKPDRLIHLMMGPGINDDEHCQFCFVNNINIPSMLPFKKQSLVHFAVYCLANLNFEIRVMKYFINLYVLLLL